MKIYLEDIQSLGIYYFVQKLFFLLVALVNYVLKPIFLLNGIIICEREVKVSEGGREGGRRLIPVASSPNTVTLQ